MNVFRKASLMKRNFSRLKNRPLGIHPLYVRREDHAQGMVCLLSLALRVLTLLEHVVRKNLQSSRESKESKESKEGERLSGLYAGNPKRQTATPTTERLLKAFGSIHLNIVKLPGQTLLIRHTPLSALQTHVLSLLNLPSAIYEGLCLELSFDTS